MQQRLGENRLRVHHVVLEKLLEEGFGGIPCLLVLGELRHRVLLEARGKRGHPARLTAQGAAAACDGAKIQ